jgi:hypothetical protein
MKQMVLIFIASVLVVFAQVSHASLHEAYETVATCQTKDPANTTQLKVLESTSSVRAILELTRPGQPGQEPVEMQYLQGVKDDSVRDPIVFQYEFDGYELMIWLERQDDGTYPAKLLWTSPSSEGKEESFSCRL